MTVSMGNGSIYHMKPTLHVYGQDKAGATVWVVADEEALREIMRACQHALRAGQGSATGVQDAVENQYDLVVVRMDDEEKWGSLVSPVGEYWMSSRFQTTFPRDLLVVDGRVKTWSEES